MGSIDSTLRKKEEELEKLDLENQIADKKREIAERRALEARAKKEYGKDWKNILLGATKGLSPNKEAIQTLYSTNGDLKRYSRPGQVKVRA